MQYLSVRVQLQGESCLIAPSGARRGRTVHPFPHPQPIVLKGTKNSVSHPLLVPPAPNHPNVQEVVAVHVTKGRGQYVAPTVAGLLREAWHMWGSLSRRGAAHLLRVGGSPGVGDSAAGCLGPGLCWAHPAAHLDTG